MPFLIIKISEPSDTLDTNESLPAFINTTSRRIKRVIFGNGEFPVSAMDGRAQPHLVLFEKRKYLLVVHGVQIAYDKELLAVLYELGDIFTKKGERRIGDHDICFLQQRDTLGGAEVAVAFQFRQHVLVVLDEPFHVRKVDASVAVFVFHLGDDDLVRRLPAPFVS